MSTPEQRITGFLDAADADAHLGRVNAIDHIWITDVDDVTLTKSDLRAVLAELASVRETIAKKIEAKFITGELDDWDAGYNTAIHSAAKIVRGVS